MQVAETLKEPGSRFVSSGGQIAQWLTDEHKWQETLFR